MFSHIAALVSDSPVTLFIAMRVRFRFFSDVLRGSDFFCSRIPLYVVACVKVESFAPWMSKSMGISRFRGSGVCLFAPCFTSASLPSFPWILS